MSKREYKTRDYIEWLKSLGCVLYLPLSTNGDLTDWISGLPLQPTGNGSMVWDVDEEMYLITSPSVANQYVALLDNGFSKSMFPNNEFSVLLTERLITNNGSKWHNQISTLCNNNNYNDYFTCSGSVGTSKTSVFPHVRTDFARTVDSNNIIQYQNGVQAPSTSTASSILPQNWVTIGNGLAISLPATSVKTSVEFYMKDIYLFNKVLDLATIRKIQGYE